jgi:putative acetyltransferase
MSEFTLRPATNADRQVVTALVFSVLREYGLTTDPEATDADLCDLEGQYAGRGGAFDVLEDAKGVVQGCVGLYPLDPVTCELRKMYLRPDVRGLGLGRRLLDHALNRAQAFGFKRVTLETSSGLAEAIRLYTRAGFRAYQADHMSQRCDQAYVLDLERGT